MAISKIGGTDSDNWELISSVTPTVSTTTVNFTSLAVHRKFMIVVNAVTLATASSLSMRFNNDANSKYIFNYWESTPDIRQTDLGTEFTWTDSNAEQNGVFVIKNCDTSNIKEIEYAWGGNATTLTRWIENGIYLASAPISQVNVFSGENFLGAGTISLYGVK